MAPHARHLLCSSRAIRRQSTMNFAKLTSRSRNSNVRELSKIGVESEEAKVFSELITSLNRLNPLIQFLGVPSKLPSAKWIPKPQGQGTLCMGVQLLYNLRPVTSSTRSTPHISV